MPLAQTVETFLLVPNVRWVSDEADVDLARGNGFAVCVNDATYTGPAALVVLVSLSPIFWPLARLLVLGPFPALLRGYFWVISIGLCEQDEVRSSLQVAAFVFVAACEQFVTECGSTDLPVIASAARQVPMENESQSARVDLLPSRPKDLAEYVSSRLSHWRHT